MDFKLDQEEEKRTPEERAAYEARKIESAKNVAEDILARSEQRLREWDEYVARRQARVRDVRSARSLKHEPTAEWAVASFLLVSVAQQACPTVAYTPKGLASAEAHESRFEEAVRSWAKRGGSSMTSAPPRRPLRPG